MDQQRLQYRRVLRIVIGLVLSQQDSIKRHVVSMFLISDECSVTVTSPSLLHCYLPFKTDIYYGQWCPTPRSCGDLVNCIENEKNAVRQRPAFLQYLEDAPEVKPQDFGDPTKCGELREYFDYDRDYADDDRICEEVRDLKVRGGRLNCS